MYCGATVPRQSGLGESPALARHGLGDRRGDLRARALPLPLAVYGQRSGEARIFRLEDLAREAEMPARPAFQECPYGRAILLDTDVALAVPCSLVSDRQPKRHRATIYRFWTPCLRTRQNQHSRSAKNASRHRLSSSSGVGHLFHSVSLRCSVSHAIYRTRVR